MNVLVTYSSLTGNTKQLAEGIYEGIEGSNKTILPMKEVENTDGFDVVLVGYWPDTEHGWNSLINGENLVKEHNKVIGKYVCQGKLSEKIISMFEKFPADNPHAITDEKRRRYAIAQNHPSEADIRHGAELFRERLLADVSN